MAFLWWRITCENYSIPNALAGRDSVEIEIFGMEGVPYEDLQRHIEKKEKEFGGGKNHVCTCNDRYFKLHTSLLDYNDQLLP